MKEIQASRLYAMDGQLNLEVASAEYLPLVERLALRMADTYGLDDPQELVSAAHLALWETLIRYDPQKANLHRYVMVTVRQRLLDAIRQGAPLDHRQWQRLRALRQMWAELEERWGRPPTDLELARALAIPPAKLEELYRIEAQVSSPVPWDRAEAAAQESLSVEETVVLQSSLESALQKLPEREQRILYAVYVGGYTTAEIAAVLGLEASWVRRLRGKALTALRAELAKVDAEPGSG